MPFALILTPQVEGVRAHPKLDAKKRNKITRCLAKLATDPAHPGLSSHRYTEIKGPLGEAIWESYVENHAPSAWRVWWFYGPGEGEITVVAVGPHP